MKSKWEMFGASLIRGILALGSLPDKAYISLDAIIRTIYRMKISKKHLLEWTTSEEAESLAKGTLTSYYQKMLPNIVLGIFSIVLGIRTESILLKLFLICLQFF